MSKPRSRRIGWLGLLLATVLAGLARAVFPIQDLLAQRRATAGLEAELATLRADNDALDARIAALRTDAEIERLAREQYNLVYPGEESYAILPVEPEGSPVPGPWPF
jgi:cell division protein FtsB